MLSNGATNIVEIFLADQPIKHVIGRFPRPDTGVSSPFAWGSQLCGLQLIWMLRLEVKYDLQAALGHILDTSKYLILTR